MSTTAEIPPNCKYDRKPMLWIERKQLFECSCGHLEKLDDKSFRCGCHSCQYPKEQKSKPAK